MEGLVVKSTGSWYDVRCADGQVFTCRIRGKFRTHGIKYTNPVVVGDTVTFEMEKDGTGIISKILPRRNYIERKSTNLSKVSHLIASNIDIVFLVVTLKEPRTSLGFIDRFLVAAESFRIPVCLVFNKMDLYDGEELAEVEALCAMYQRVGYDTLCTSVVTGQGIEDLKGRLESKVSLFSGHSGTGKSALVNAVEPSLQLRVGEISQQHHKGKHTTTFAEMFPFAGGYLMDTPGIKEFGLIRYAKEEVRDYFPEIREIQHECRFSNCLHIQEPGCAVLKAVEEGEIPASRYLNYVSIMEDEDMSLTEWQLR
ncbi:MAG: ribosome small subunit-dependent GTPase A [Bacteroidales bacterium]|nr:ribosome small subunit-dependent GTPase A [Bacteroidales bacterium]